MAAFTFGSKVLILLINKNYRAIIPINLLTILIIASDLMTSETPSFSDPAIRVTMMPKDTNHAGTIFGGVILSYLDLAGAVEARKHCNQLFVTVAMHGVEFIAPVFVGDLVSFYTQTQKLGRTSVTVDIIVEAVRLEGSGEKVRVMEAQVVYVAVDANRRPIPIKNEISVGPNDF